MRNNNYNTLANLSSHASLMVSILSSNKRHRKSAFSKLSRYVKEGKTKLSFKKQASIAQIKQIRNQIQKENQRQFIITFLAISILSVSQLLAIALVKF